jgi:hypothetical protein
MDGWMDGWMLCGQETIYSMEKKKKKVFPVPELTTVVNYVQETLDSMGEKKSFLSHG